MKTEKLIIIDDKIEGLIPIKIYLEKELNITVNMFDSVCDAINSIKETNNVFSILLDIRMPTISGIEAAKIIKNSKILCPILFFTEMTPNSEFLKEAYQAGIVDYIIKPTTTEEKEIIKNKLNVFLNMSVYKHQLEIEVENKQNIINKLEVNFYNYKNLIDNIQLAYIITDTNLNILECNNFSLDIHDFKTGVNFSEYIAKDHHDILNLTHEKLQAQQTLMINNNNLNAELLLTNHKIINLIGNTQNTNESKYIFLLQDITSEKIEETQKNIRKERAIKEIKKSLQSIASRFEVA